MASSVEVADCNQVNTPPFTPQSVTDASKDGGVMEGPAAAKDVGMSVSAEQRCF